MILEAHFKSVAHLRKAVMKIIIKYRVCHFQLWILKLLKTFPTKLVNSREVREVLDGTTRFCDKKPSKFG